MEADEFYEMLNAEFDHKIKERSWHSFKREQHLKALGVIRAEIEVLRDELDQIKNEVRAVSQTDKIRILPRHLGDEIYDANKAELERKHMGEIVAIDEELKKVVGHGKTIVEAYHDARKASSKEQFYFRKVGKPYIHRM